MSRGAQHWIDGPDDDAKELGLDPVSSGVRTEDEGLYLVQHGYWKKELRKAVEAEAVEAAAAAELGV
jgi:benzoate/toluate 1,2-dioxygenase alpha subunit